MHAPSPRTLAARERRANTHVARPAVRRNSHHNWLQQRLQQRHPIAQRCAAASEHANA